MKKILFLFCLFGILIFSNFASASLIDDLKAYWTFESTTGIERNVFNDHNSIATANITTGVTRGVSGIIGTSFYYNGNGYATTNYSNEMIDLNSTVGTISLWFNWTGQAAGIVGLFKLGDFADANSIRIIFDNRSSALRNISVSYAGGSNIFQMSNISLNKLALGKFYHLAVVFNGSDIQMYLNGTLMFGSYLQHTVPGWWFRNTLNVGKRMSLFGQDTDSNFTGSIDEVGIWTRNLSAAEVLQLYDEGIAGTRFFSPISTSLDSPVNGSTILNPIFDATINPINLNLTNATIYVWYNNGTLFNKTTNTVTGIVSNSTSFNISSIISPNSFKWNVLGCGKNNSNTASFCSFADSNFTFDYGYLINNETHSSSVSELSSQTFVLNTSLISGLISSSAYLTYNYTIYTATKTTSGDNAIFTTTFITPNVAGATTINYNWTLNLIDSNGIIFSKNVSSQSQIVSPIAIDNCTVNTGLILNFTLWDEDDKTPLNGTIDLIIKIYSTNTSTLVQTFNKSYAYNPINANAIVCRNLINETYSMSYEAKYWSNISFYPIEYKYADKIAHNNNTGVQNIKLYDLLTSRTTVCTFAVQDANLVDLPNVVVDVQRQYISLDSFLSVEAPKTDYSGQTIAHLVLYDVLYNFLVYNDGELVGTFNNYKVSSSTCVFTFNLLQVSAKIKDYTKYGDISAFFDLNKATRTLTMNWITTDSLLHEIKWNVINNDNWGNTTICTNSQIGTSGAFVCNIPETYGNTTIYAEVYSSGNSFIGRWFFGLGETSSEIFEGIRVIFGMLMYTTIVLMMIFDPVFIVIGSMLGIVFAGAFHLVDGGTWFGNLTVVIYFAIAGGIIIFYLNKKS